MGGVDVQLGGEEGGARGVDGGGGGGGAGFVDGAEFAVPRGCVSWWGAGDWGGRDDVLKYVGATC